MTSLLVPLVLRLLWRVIPLESCIIVLFLVVGVMLSVGEARWYQ